MRDNVSLFPLSQNNILKSITLSCLVYVSPLKYGPWKVKGAWLLTLKSSKASSVGAQYVFVE